MARRDRHGRGPRGPLIVGSVPPSRTRRGTFEALVIDAALHLQDRWGAELGDLAVAVDDLPPDIDSRTDSVPLGQTFPGSTEAPHRIVLYRRPISDRSPDARSLAETIRDVLAEQVAILLGRAAEDIDPDYGM